MVTEIAKCGEYPGILLLNSVVGGGPALPSVIPFGMNFHGRNIMCKYPLSPLGDTVKK